jgi:voltage-gated potassium channel
MRRGCGPAARTPATARGYGDVYPVTPLGKVLAGLTALTGIGILVMPTGILAAAFSDALRRRHRVRDKDETAGADKD